MSRIVVGLCGLLVGAAFARGADSSLVAAQRAQAALGPEIWSEVIRVENVAAVSYYPRTLHALVFELADILWFYTSVDGTQSLSLHRGRLAEEKADLAPLLRAIEPGFSRWTVISDELGAPRSTAGRRGELPNGCFIESVAELRVRRERGESVADAQLLSYYVDTSDGLRGHTVLTYTAGRVVEVIDPSRHGRSWRFPETMAGDPLNLARAFAGGLIAKARWVPIDRATAHRGFFAFGGLLGGGEGGDATVWQR